MVHEGEDAEARGRAFEQAGIPLFGLDGWIGSHRLGALELPHPGPDGHGGRLRCSYSLVHVPPDGDPGGAIVVTTTTAPGRAPEGMLDELTGRAVRRRATVGRRFTSKEIDDLSVLFEVATRDEAFVACTSLDGIGVVVSGRGTPFGDLGITRVVDLRPYLERSAPGGPSR